MNLNFLGISIHRGYAFIQYNSVEAAQIAAQSQHQQRITNQIAGFYIHLLLLVTNFLIKTSKLPLNLGRNLFQPYQHRLLSLLLSRLLLIASSYEMTSYSLMTSYICSTVTSKPAWKRTPQSSKSKVHNGRISKISSQTNNKNYSSKVKVTFMVVYFFGFNEDLIFKLFLNFLEIFFNQLKFWEFKI